MLMLTIMIKDRNSSGCRRTVKEEHYVVVSFPGDSYIDYVVPSSSNSV